MAVGEPAGPGARAAGRMGGVRQGLAAAAVRSGLVRHRVARGVRRARRVAHPADHLPGGDGAREGAAADQPRRVDHGRSGADRARHRGAEARPPAGDPRRRRDLVPGLLGARCRLRPRRAADARRPRRRPLRRQRTEGVDQLRALRRLVHGARPHRSGRAEASRHHLSPDRHAQPGGHRPAPPTAERRRGLQRGLLRRRARPARERDRCRRRRLGHRHHVPDARAPDADLQPPAPVRRGARRDARDGAVARARRASRSHARPLPPPWSTPTRCATPPIAT